MPRPLKFVSRTDLGWGPSPAAYADPRSGLVIHYDSADQGLAGKPHSACLEYWRRTRAFHTGPRRGWVDVGYSWFACSHGYVIEGRGLRRAQAAQPGGNSSHYSCTLATGPNDTVTPEQIDAVRGLRQWLMEPDTSIAGTVLGHRDFIATSCPGDRAYALVRDGTFTAPPGAITTTEGSEPMLGLTRGDGKDNGKAREVAALQRFLKRIDDRFLPEWGVDNEYGQEVSDAVLAVRKMAYPDTSATDGDTVTSAAWEQLWSVYIRTVLGGGGSASLPATVRVSGELVVER